MTIPRLRPEEEFSAAQRRATRAQAEHDIALQERAEHIARLRALRLAKIATDAERAKNASATETAAEDENSAH